MFTFKCFINYISFPCNRWNSYYDVIKCLLEVINDAAHLEALNTIMRNVNLNNTLPGFDMMDKQVKVNILKSKSIN